MSTIKILEYFYDKIYFQLLSERREHMRMTISPGPMAAITGAGSVASNIVPLLVTGPSQVR